MAFDQMRNGFIQEECDGTVDASLQRIEGDDGGDHHAHNHFQRSTHEQGREDHIHYDHRQCLHDSTADQSEYRCFLCFVAFIDIAGNQHAEACGEDMHDDTDDAALSGNGHALNKGNHHGQQEACSRTICKGTDQNRNICGVIFQKCRCGNQRKMDRTMEIAPSIAMDTSCLVEILLLLAIVTFLRFFV